MTLRPHGPEPCASTNSAIWAFVYKRTYSLVTGPVSNGLARACQMGKYAPPNYIMEYIGLAKQADASGHDLCRVHRFDQVILRPEFLSQIQIAGLTTGA